MFETKTLENFYCLPHKFVLLQTKFSSNDAQTTLPYPLCAAQLLYRHALVINHMFIHVLRCTYVENESLKIQTLYLHMAIKQLSARPALPRGGTKVMMNVRQEMFIIQVLDGISTNQIITISTWLRSSFYLIDLQSRAAAACRPGYINIAAARGRAVVTRINHLRATKHLTAQRRHANFT